MADKKTLASLGILLAEKSKKISHLFSSIWATFLFIFVLFKQFLTDESAQGPIL